jgi:hypothetical protein
MGIKVTAADSAFSLAVRAAAAFECEHCGAELSIPKSAPAPFMPREGDKGECAHLIGRRTAQTRWDLANAVALCHNCHRLFTEEPKLFHDWIESEWTGRWEILYDKKAGNTVSNDASTRTEVSAHYRNELNRLTGAGGIYRIISWI